MTEPTLITIDEAADVLNVRREYIIRLLDSGELPCAGSDRRRRMTVRDVLTYKHAMDKRALEALVILAREAQEAGDYFG